MPLPAGRQTVGCKWIFKVKRNSDGSVARYKDRLVVKGYLQEARVDFQETFSPVVKPTTIRLVLAFAVSLGWSLRQVDINNAFLNGDLQEDIYMVQPPGFEQLGPDGQQLKFILEAKFQASKADSSLFIQNSGSQLIYVLVYVDDIVVTGTNSSAIDKFVTELHDRFSLKDLGRLNYFLRIQVTYSSTGIFLSQQKHIQDLLCRASMDKLNSSPTHMVSTCHLSNHEGSPIEDEHLFRSIVGALQYVIIIRPDIAFAVNKFTRSSKFLLEGYSDASWGSDSDDRRSTSGFCVFFGGNLVSWSSRKQQVVSRSTAEAEYRSLAHVTAEMIWIQSLLSEFSAPVKVKALVWCDSSAAVVAASNPVMHLKFKHVELDLFFVREKVAKGSLQMGHVSSQDQVADILTKPLSIGLFSKFRSQLRVAACGV
ncbi:hypothetical protein CXB51_029912 [Gossypium anomalum]|uniref:Reverse transcriptase Ty1/copia-type domain-containing protein n=1 Tax=Gossypium anomalum TaxID=47600 RepID=A0A8J6CLK4_9ROSI|nr:hypothetical protein CXB51_029912 [Gossypium anomalum]